MLISLAPGILSLMPGVRLTVGLSLLPLVNIVLLGKELFQGIASPLHFVITLLATSGYTVLALQIASRIFGSDMVLFAANASVGGLKKRPQQTVSQVPLKLGIGGLAVLIPAFIVLAGLRGRLVAPENLSGQLVLSGLMTILLFAVFPLLLTTWNRVQFASGYAVRGFSPSALIGAILLGATLWTTMYETLLLAKGSSAWAKILSNPKLQELAQRLTSENTSAVATDIVIRHSCLVRGTVLSRVPDECSAGKFRTLAIPAADEHFSVRSVSRHCGSIADTRTFSGHIPAWCRAGMDSTFNGKHHPGHRDAHGQQWVAVVAHGTAAAA